MIPSWVARSFNSARIFSASKPRSCKAALTKKVSFTQPSSRFSGCGYSLIPMTRARRFGGAVKTLAILKLRTIDRDGMAKLRQTVSIVDG